MDIRYGSKFQESARRIYPCFIYISNNHCPSSRYLNRVYQSRVAIESGIEWSIQLAREGPVTADWVLLLGSDVSVVANVDTRFGVHVISVAVATYHSTLFVTSASEGGDE